MRGVWIILFAILGLVVVLAGLSPGARSATPDPGDIRTLAPVLEVKLKGWLIEWQAVQPGLRVDQFKKVDTRTIKGSWRTVDLGFTQNDPLRVFYVFSRDGRWIVDPFGGVSLMKQDSYFEVFAGPDTSARLMDRKTLKLREILVCGTSCGFHEAVWLSSDSFVVAGYGEVGPEQSCPRGYPSAPSLYVFSPTRDSFTWYAGPASCRGIGFDYVSHKIQKKIPNVK